MKSKFFTLTGVLLFFLTGWSLESNAECVINASTSDGCENVDITFSVDFTRSDERDIDDIDWDFGDGTSSNLEEPTHVYSAEGDYTVSVSIEFDDGTTCEVDFDEEINIFDDPVADFSTDVPPGEVICFGDAEDGINFFDESRPGNSDAPIDNWAWDFGDGNTSNEQNPNHSYSSSGSFRPILQVSDTNGCVDEYQWDDDELTVGEDMGLDMEVVGFPQCPETEYTLINFSDIDLEDVESFTWDFGDGEDTTGGPDDEALWDDVTHIYTGDSCYIPTLIVEDVNGCEEEFDGEEACNIDYTMDIQLNPEQPMCHPTELQLSHEEREDATEVIWAINDDDHEEPIKAEEEDWWQTEFTFTGPGIYDIYYSIEEPGCTKDTVLCNAVEVHGPSAQIHDDEIDYRCELQPYSYFAGHSELCFDEDTDYMSEISDGNFIEFVFYDNDEINPNDESGRRYAWFNTGPGNDPFGGTSFEDNGHEIVITDINNDEELLERIADSLVQFTKRGNCLRIKERNNPGRLMEIDLGNSNMPDNLSFDIHYPVQKKPPMMSWEGYIDQMENAQYMSINDLLGIIPDPYHTNFANYFICEEDTTLFPTVFATQDWDTVHHITRSYDVPPSQIDTAIVQSAECMGGFALGDFMGLSRPKYGSGDPWVDTIYIHEENEVVDLGNDYILDPDEIYHSFLPNREHIVNGSDPDTVVVGDTVIGDTIFQNFSISNPDSIYLDTFYLNHDKGRPEQWVYMPKNADCPPYDDREALAMNTNHIYSPNCGPPHTVDFSNMSTRFTGEREMFDIPAAYLDFEKDEYLHPDYPYASDKMDYEWDFGDGNTSNEIAPTHTYYDADIYDVTLTVTDPETGCEDEANIQIVVDVPDASKIDIQPRPNPCVGPVEIYPYDVMLDSVIPSEPDDLWLVHDSAAQANFEKDCSGPGCPDLLDSLVSYQWTDLEQLEEDNFEVNYTSPGWKTVGVIVKAGNCYDTTWVNDMHYVSDVNPQVDWSNDTLGGAHQNYVNDLNFNEFVPLCPGQRDIYPHNKFLVSEFELPNQQVLDTIGSGVLAYPHEFMFENLNPIYSLHSDCIDTLEYHMIEVTRSLRTTDLKDERILRDSDNSIRETYSVGDTIQDTLYVLDSDKLNFPIAGDFYDVSEDTVFTGNISAMLNNLQHHHLHDTVTGMSWSFPNVSFGDEMDDFQYPSSGPEQGTYDTLFTANNDTLIVAKLTEKERVLFPEPGIYDVTQFMQNTSQCQDASQLQFTIGYFDNLTVDDSIVCTGEEVVFHDSVYFFQRPDPDFPLPELDTTNLFFYEEENIMYDFTGDGNIDYVQGEEKTPVTFTYDEPGVYEVSMYTTIGQCWMRNTQKIHVSQPVAGFEFPGDDVVCAEVAGQFVQFTDTSYSPRENYIYPRSSFSLDTSDYDPAALGGKQLDYFPVLVSEDSNEVEIDPIDRWSWNFDDGRGYVEGIAQNPTRTYRENGVFEILQVVETEAGCTDTARHEMEIEGPKPGFEILVDQEGCAPFEVTLVDTTKDYREREFMLGDGRTISNPLSDTVRFEYHEAGEFEISLIATDQLITAGGDTVNCAMPFPNPQWEEHDDINTTITVWKQDTARLTVEEHYHCRGDEIFFNNESDTLPYDSQSVAYRWEFGDGNVTSTGDIDVSVSHRYSDTGTFEVFMFPENTRCPDTTSTEVHIQDVEVDFDYDKENKPDVHFTADAHGKDLTYEWDFDDGNTSTEGPEVTNTYSEQGNYEVCLVVTDDIGCSEEVCKNVDIISMIHVPNVFSPTGDNINDELIVTVNTSDLTDEPVKGVAPIHGIMEFEMVIFNRWGEKVFETNHEEGIESWNGTVMNDGRDCEPGTYYYSGRFRLIGDEESTEFKGTVNLFR